MDQINTHTFAYCSALKRATLPETISVIGGAAFCNCHQLQTINIPNNDSLRIGEGAFTGCNALADPDGFIIVAGVLYGFEGTKDNIAIPKGVRKIGAQAFWGKRAIRNALLPEGLEEISFMAFDNCTLLESISLPKSLKRVDFDTFHNCGNLRTVNNLCGDICFGSGVFRDCVGLANQKGFVIVGDVLYSYHGENIAVSIPSGIRAISSYAFCRNDQIEQLTIPEGVENIGLYSFSNMRRLKSVSFPSTLKTIDQNAFSECNELVSVILPNGLEAIRRGAFSLCRNLKSVVLPRSLRILDYDAFFDRRSILFRVAQGSFAEKTVREYGCKVEYL